MRIKSLLEGVEKIVHHTGEYEAGKGGIFDVPEEVGRELINFPHYAQDLGEDAETAAKIAAGDVHAELEAARKRIVELEAEIAKLTDKAKAPAKSAAKKAPAKKPAAKAEQPSA